MPPAARLSTRGNEAANSPLISINLYSTLTPLYHSVQDGDGYTAIPSSVSRGEFVALLRRSHTVIHIAPSCYPHCFQPAHRVGGCREKSCQEPACVGRQITRQSIKAISKTLVLRLLPFTLSTLCPWLRPEKRHADTRGARQSCRTATPLTPTDGFPLRPHPRRRPRQLRDGLGTLLSFPRGVSAKIGTAVSAPALRGAQHPFRDGRPTYPASRPKTRSRAAMSAGPMPRLRRPS